MGTNYYLCGPQFDQYKDDEYSYGLHIGLSSAGWSFRWRAHSEPKIFCRDDWEKLILESGDCCIRNEYGAFLFFNGFKRIAYHELRRGTWTGEMKYFDPDIEPDGNLYFLDPQGEAFANLEFC